jgi:hypothetical protein
MEAMTGISLYSYPYHKLGKVLCLSYYFLCLLFKKLEKRAEQIMPGRVRVVRGEEGYGEQRGKMAQTMHAHTNK